MTQQDFAALIDQFDGDVTSQAYKIIPKIQQPHPWTVEDLKQEALTVAWHKFQKHFDPNKSGARTFLFMCVGNALYDILAKSWNNPTVSLVGEFESEESPNFQFESRENKSVQGIGNLIKEGIFNSLETKYIQLTVFPPEGLAKINAQNPKRSRIYVRQMLGITPTEEVQIRKSIRDKLERRICV